MPFITEDDLLDFHKKIDDLTDKNKKLDELNDSYYKKIKQGKLLRLVFVVLSGVFLLLFVGAVAYFTTKEPEVKTVEVIKEVPVETTSTETPETETDYSEATSETAYKDFYFTVQVGAYREYHQDLEHCLQKFEKNGLSCYVIGQFDDIESSEAYKSEMVQLGLKGAHTVCVSQGELLTLKEAKDQALY